MPDSLRLKSSEKFLETPPSISSEIWALYYSAIPGSSVFCDWLCLVFSGVAPETVANFLLFLDIAMILRENRWNWGICQFWRLNWFLIW